MQSCTWSVCYCRLLKSSKIMHTINKVKYQNKQMKFYAFIVYSHNHKQQFAMGLCEPIDIKHALANFKLVVWRYFGLILDTKLCLRNK